MFTKPLTRAPRYILMKSFLKIFSESCSRQVYSMSEWFHSNGVTWFQGGQIMSWSNVKLGLSQLSPGKVARTHEHWFSAGCKQTFGCNVLVLFPTSFWAGLLSTSCVSRSLMLSSANYILTRFDGPTKHSLWQLSLATQLYHWPFYCDG